MELERLMDEMGQMAFEEKRKLLLWLTEEVAMEELARKAQEVAIMPVWSPYEADEAACVVGALMETFRGFPEDE